MHRFLLILLLTSVLNPSTSESSSYRLPAIFDIVSYDVSLMVPEATLTSADNNHFSGDVMISFIIKSPTNQIQLHVSDQYLKITDITFGSQNFTMEPIDNETDILTIKLNNDLLPDNSIHLLLISFDGQLSNDMTGFYKSSYQDNQKVTHYLATTQFQPTHARKAFPCFDEPSFKSHFDIRITVPNSFVVLSNTKSTTQTPGINRTTEYAFQTTPNMSSYLIAFIIYDTDYSCSSGTPIDNIPYQICSRKDETRSRELALEVGPKLLSHLNSHTGVNYQTMGLGKLDQVAIPDFAAGAMENWGLVTYREMYILWNEKESTNIFKQYVVDTIAHELAHFWFGNLVTPSWWSDTYLNEGFATYYEYHATHAILPEWQLDKQFVISVVQEVLLEDSQNKTLPLHADVQTPSEIQEHFGRISYFKGGAIFRMLRHIMGTDNFEAGLKRYLEQNKYENVIVDDLWAALNACIESEISNVTELDTVMKNWIENPGYPLVTVTVEGGNAQLTQGRFLLNGEEDNSTWHIPITYTTSVDTDKFVSTSPEFWLENDLTIPLPTGASWIILNNQQTGYYRVNYDDSTWTNIGQALQSNNFGDIVDINRAQIVDDLFNLARANKVKYQTVFEVTEFLKDDISYFVWTPTFNGFNYLLERVGFDTELGQKISAHILRLMTNLYESTKFILLDESNHIHSLNQMNSLAWACKLGHEDCVTSAKALLLADRIYKVRPNKNIRNVVYCAALRDSTDQDDLEFLFQAYVTTTVPSERNILLASLGCTRNETFLRRILEYSIEDDSQIEIQDRDFLFQSVLTGSSAGYEIALDFLINNYDAIKKAYQSLNALPKILAKLSSKITEQEHYDKFKDFLENLDDEDHSKMLAAAGNNLQWKMENLEEITNVFIPKTSASSSFGISFIAFSTGIFIIIFNYVHQY